MLRGAIVKVTFGTTNTSKPYTPVSVAGYTLIQDTQFTVGAALVPIYAPAAGLTYTYIFVNRSGAGQNIRVGRVPSFGAPVSGLLLAVNDTLTLENVLTAIQAISNAAGALLDCMILEQPFDV